jgi:hypothetical protein
VVAYRDAAFGINGDHAGESFARYLLTRLLAQDPGLVYRMLVIIVTQAQWDNRQGALQLRKGACLLFGRIVERNRSTTRCYISFYDELSGIRFRNHLGMSHRFAFTVQHVISIVVDGWIPLSLTQHTVHFCHLRNCCRPGHFYWNTAANNRCRDTCRIRGFSFYRLNQEDRRVICFCPHEPRCLILRNEFGMPEVPDERAMRRANYRSRSQSLQRYRTTARSQDKEQSRKKNLSRKKKSTCPFGTRQRTTPMSKFRIQQRRAKVNTRLATHFKSRASKGNKAREERTAKGNKAREERTALREGRGRVLDACSLTATMR